MELFDAELPERFWAKVSPEPNSGCWLWTAGLDRYGYGKFKLNGRTVGAHTVYRRVTAGCHRDHKCRTRCCVNPRHLEIVTYLENQRRGIEARRKG